MSSIIKVAKVIATAFTPRSVRLRTSITGDPLLFMAHSQNFTSTKEIIDLLLLNIDLEKKYDPGVKIYRDLIIVSPEVRCKKGNIFLDTINNTKIPKGKVIVLKRKNFGMSYGSYSDAFKIFRKNYNYFLFTEDDWLIYGNDYLKTGIDIIASKKNIGFVAYQAKTKIGRHHWKYLNINNDKNAFSCHSCCGLSSTLILNKIYKKYKKLPHYKGNDYFKSIRYGECMFGNSFYKIGYEITNLPKDKILGMPAYDFIRNVKYKKFPNLFEIIYIYYLKNFLKRNIGIFIWKIISKTNLTKELYLKSILKLKKIFYYLKSKIKYRYAFKGKFKSYEEAMQNQKLDQLNYNKFLDEYYLNRAREFRDHSKVNIYGRFLFATDFIKAIEKNKIKIFEIGGGNNPVISYLKLTCQKKFFSYILEIEQFVKYIQDKIPKYYIKDTKYITNYKNININNFDIAYFGSSLQYVYKLDELLEFIFTSNIKHIIVTDIFLTLEKKNFFVLGYADKPLVMPNQFIPYDDFIAKFKKNKYSVTREIKKSAKEYTHSSINNKTYHLYDFIFTKVK